MASVTVFKNVRCARCGKTPPIQQGFTNDRGFQYDNTLTLTLGGGYGMFLDDLDAEFGRQDAVNPRTTKILCHECSHAFCEFMGIDPSNWHTHVSAEHGGTQHADHHDGATGSG